MYILVDVNLEWGRGDEGDMGEMTEDGKGEKGSGGWCPKACQRRCCVLSEVKYPPPPQLYRQINNPG